MTEDLILKTIPLAIAKHAGSARGTKEERAARVQEHMDRVHPVLESMQEEENCMQIPVDDHAERSRFNSMKSHRKQRALAKLRAEAIAARRGQ